MKKKFLILSCLFLSLANSTFAAEVQDTQIPSEIRQKACKNVFSFIIGLSAMSARNSTNEVNISDVKSDDCQESETVPIANESETEPTTENPKNKTSLFRLDLLRLIRIQIN